MYEACDPSTMMLKDFGMLVLGLWAGFCFMSWMLCRHRLRANASTIRILKARNTALTEQGLHYCEDVVVLETQNQILRPELAASDGGLRCDG